MRASRLLSRKAIGLHQVKFSQPQPCLLSGRISCIRDDVNCPQQSPWKIRVSRLVCISADSAYLQKKTRVSKVKLSFPSRLLHCVTFASTCTAQRPPPLHKVLEQLECPGTPADLTIYASLVQQCGNAKALSHGRLLHSYIITSTSHGESTYLMSLLVQMYGQCAALKDACIVFSHIQERNIYSWNIMIGTNVKLGEWLEATRLFQQMQVEGVIPDKYSIVSTLSAYAGLETLPQGKALHSRFACTELEKDVVVGTALINLYGHCGSTECAELMFAKLQERDLVLCNAMITVHAQQGHGNEALQLFNHMHQEGFIPNKVTFLGILDSCAGYTGLAVGKRLHIHIRHAGLESDVFVVTTLMSMYGKCGSLERAEVLFDELSEQNVVSWNAIIAVHAHQEHGEDVLQLLNQMQQEALIPDKVTFRTILCSFAGQTSIVRCKLVHTCATCCGFDSDIVVGTALFSMYGRCGSLESARKLFDGMFKRDLVAWNAMIALYAQNGHDKEALQLLRQMQQAGVVPDKVTLISSLTACAGASLEAAQRLFDKIHERNVVVWNAMLGACVQHGHSKQAFQLFEQMLGEKVTPDKVTFLAMLSACASRAAVMEGKWVHTLIICSQFESHGPLVSGLVHMYNKCGGLEEACAVFQHMHERDAIVFNAMITAYTEHGHGKEVLQFWVQMQQEAVIPDEVTFIGILDACATEGTLVKGKCIHACITESKYGSEIIVATSLFNMYHKCSSLEEAHSVFGSMVQHDVVSWTAIITANTEKNESKVVLQLFHQMQTEGVLADNGIYVNVLAACADEAALMEGKMIHTQIIHNDLGPDVSLGNALVNMYGKCGSMEDAQREFHKMPGQDVLSFNIMIAGCAQHGHGKKALQLYDQMQQQGTVPNEYTFGSVLSACSHAGLVEEGHKCLIMIEDHGSTPAIEHYDCMVDLLGRTGRLEEAEGLLDEIPMQPTPVSWMTLLAASRIQMDIGRGERVSQHLFELDVGDASPYVALANLYAVAGRRENSEGVISWKEVGGYSSRLISGIDTLVPHVTAADHASITLLSLQNGIMA